MSGDEWRVRHFTPWIWREGGRWRRGWRVVVTAAGRRLDVRGSLVEVVRAAVDWPDWRDGRR